MRLPLFQVGALLASTASAASPDQPADPFLTQIGNQTWVIGNDVWNLTQGRNYGVKLMYGGRDLVGSAVGHYVSYNGAVSNLNWTSAAVVARGTHNGTAFADIRFTAREAELHWVVFAGQHGAYQYLVNRALPVLGELRTLWRLDNGTFTRGATGLRDEALPPLRDFVAANRVQDETWRAPAGDGYITKYDFSAWVRRLVAYGVYGEGRGSWYINAGKDYYNGNHLKQELTVHRESRTGDAVMLNMIHGTHFQGLTNDSFADGKMWGPWLWYLNNGSQADAQARAAAEFAAWPYAWLGDAAYQARGSVQGRLVLSDGRPASHAAVFLGDAGSTASTLSQGAAYYYTAHCDAAGRFAVPHVRAGVYALHAWSNGSALADVASAFARDGVAVAAGRDTQLGELVWPVSERRRLFRLGDFDRTAYGFRFGGAPYEHALAERCPADLEVEAGPEAAAQWCFAQTRRGNWTVRFRVPDEGRAAAPARANLIVSMAGYSGGSTAVWVNDRAVGTISGGMVPDASLVRSATTAGEWRLVEFGFDAAILRPGESNRVRFEVARSRGLSGIMYDSVILEW